MSYIVVLKPNHQPLSPLQSGEAGLVLAQRTAALWRRFPFTPPVTSAIAALSVGPMASHAFFRCADARAVSSLWRLRWSLKMGTGVCGHRGEGQDGGAGEWHR